MAPNSKRRRSDLFFATNKEMGTGRLKFNPSVPFSTFMGIDPSPRLFSIAMEIQNLLHKFHQLRDLTLECSEKVSGQHILYIDEKYVYYFKNGSIYGESSAREYYGIRTLTAERGEILELFSKFEFLVNEILRVHFFGLGSQEVFDQLVGYVDLTNRIKILKVIGIINRSMQDQIGKLVSVRNQFAHVWKTNEVAFDKIALTETANFNKFKKHLEKVFSHLIKAYQRTLLEHDFEKYLESEIKRLQTSAR